MILCTNCGTSNQDDAHQCSNCKRKLQSRRVVQNANGTNGANGGEKAETPWRVLTPILNAMDEHAAKMVKDCAEVWTYAALLLASALAMLWTQEWWYLAGGIVLTAGLAKLRGL